MKPEKMTQVYTICFLRQTLDGVEYVYLGKKQRGFMTGKYNGFGGKLIPPETLEECARRETLEECGCVVVDLAQMGIVSFKDFGLNHVCYVYVSRNFVGEPKETEEMVPSRFTIDEIPYEEMGEADYIWLPPILGGKRVVADFHYDLQDNMTDKNIGYLRDEESFEDYFKYPLPILPKI